MPHLKIAYILSKFPAFTETFITREIKEIERLGTDVEVFSLKTPLKDEAEHSENKDFQNHAHYYPFIFSTAIWKSLYFYLSTRPKTVFGLLYKVIQKNIYDPLVLIKTLAVFPKALLIGCTLKKMEINKIHSHWATVPATVSWIVSSLNSSKFTFTAHAWDIFKADNMLIEKIQAASKVITISEFNKKYLLTKYPGIDPGKIEVIHVGLELGRFRPKPRAKNPEFRILSIGRMVKTKGFQDLLHACDRLRSNDLKFTCQIIYVSDIYENKIFNLYRDLKLEGIVEFIKDVPQDKIIDYYQQADCFVLPCKVSEDGDRDGIPTVIAEALSMELPVISTYVSGIPEVIIEKKTGLLVEPGDVSGLTDNIETLYKDSDLRSRLGRAGGKFVSEEFDVSKNTKKLMDIIEGQ